MNEQSQPQRAFTGTEHIRNQAESLADGLDRQFRLVNSPDSKKKLRKFGSGEVATFLGVSTQMLRTAAAKSGLQTVEVRGGKNFYSADEMLEIRHFLETRAKRKGRYVPGRRDGDRLQIVSVENYKGGASKTTTSAMLTHYLALRGYRVLVIDSDPQASLTEFFGYRPSLDFKGDTTLYDAIADNNPVSLGDCMKSTPWPNVKIIPASLELTTWEHEVARTMQSADIPFYNRIALAIQDVDDLFDVVICDCPPSTSFLTLSVASAATTVLVPVPPAMIDVSSTAQFLEMTHELMATIEEVRGKALQYDNFKFLITKFEPSDAPAKQTEAFLRMMLGDDVLQATILKSTAISDAATFKQSIYELEKKEVNTATYTRAMTSANEFGKEIEDLIQSAWGRTNGA